MLLIKRYIYNKKFITHNYSPKKFSQGKSYVGNEKRKLQVLVL